MATINFAIREISAKLVYFGATDAGSNTNVRRLYEVLPAREKSRLHKFGPSDTEERSWYFDYVPGDDTNVEGFSLRLQVYSLPGGLMLDAHRKQVLEELDGVVFVADARAARGQANLDSLLHLEAALNEQQLELRAAPVVLQVNHVDAETARDAQDVVFDLNPYGFPVLRAVARENRGVLEAQREIREMVTQRIRDNLTGAGAQVRLTAVHRPRRTTDMDIIQQHIEAIQTLASGVPDISNEANAIVELAPGPSVEVPFQPRDFLGSHPTKLLSSHIQGDRIILDVVMKRMSSDDARRLEVVLVNRPTDTPPMERSDAPSLAPASLQSDTGSIGDYLPATVELERPPARDLPGWAYGIMGVLGGVVIGALMGYLLFT